MNNFQIRHQNGAALLVCLVILVLVSLMGLTSMRTSVLQEKMSGATSDKSLAFQAAEMALRDAENVIRLGLSSTSGFASNCAKALCAPKPGTVGAASSVNWDGDQAGTYGQASGAKPISSVSRQPSYIIELLANMKPPLGNSADLKKKGTPYRITAIGYGKLERTRVQIQSTYYKP